MTNRRAVYEAIDTERTYQDGLWAEYEASNTVASFLAYLRMYVNEALLPRAEHTDVFRKVAGLAVACMEAHGIAYRSGQFITMADISHMPERRYRVYEAIDEERDYQRSLGSHRSWDESKRIPAGRSDDEDVTRAEFLVLPDVYVRRASEAWTDELGAEPALHMVRKVAGIAVHCMELTGAPRRT